VGSARQSASEIRLSEQASLRARDGRTGDDCLKVLIISVSILLFLLATPWSMNEYSVRLVARQGDVRAMVTIVSDQLVMRGAGRAPSGTMDAEEINPCNAVFPSRLAAN